MCSKNHCHPFERLAGAIRFKTIANFSNCSSQSVEKTHKTLLVQKNHNHQLFELVDPATSRSRASEKSNSSDHQPYAKVASTWKTAVVFAGLFAVFLICWAPYFILELVIDDAGMESLPLWAVYMLFYFTRFTASAVNPVLFVVGKSDFRAALREWLRCCGITKDDEAANGTVHSLVQSQRP